MTERTAKRIGSKQGLISVGLGLLIAQIIMTAFMSLDQSFFKAFFWFTRIDYKLNIFVGAVIMLLCGHVYGQLAGKAILLKKRNSIWVGLSGGLAVLLTTGFLAGWTGFLKEGVDNIATGDNPFVDYIFKPFYRITVFGTLPAILVGLWFGWQIKREGERLDKRCNAQQHL